MDDKFFSKQLMGLLKIDFLDLPEEWYMCAFFFSKKKKKYWEFVSNRVLSIKKRIEKKRSVVFCCTYLITSNIYIKSINICQS